MALLWRMLWAFVYRDPGYDPARPWRALCGSGESPTRSGVESVSVAGDERDATVTVWHTDGTRRVYQGTCTVWRDESGERPGTLMEGWLWARWDEHVRQEVS